MLSSVVRCLFHSCDPESYQRLVVAARSVAISRPANLVQYAKTEFLMQRNAG